MKILAEYVWIGGNLELRSKTKVFPDNFSYNSVDDLPEWNFDGSSTGQAEGHDSEVIIKPRVIFPDPFRKNNNIIVLCDTYLPNGQPHTTNNRSKAKELFDKKLDEVPWFGLEQEYFMMDTKIKKPLGLNNDFLKQGKYYCSIGAENAFGRNLVEEHLEACLYAGLKISGINAEVAPGQWEFQVGPCEGIEAGDHMWMARYLLGRLSEKYDVRIEYHPKPILENINGSGCHCNFSTVSMREGTPEKTGLEIIDEALVKLSLKHMEHMEVYGEGNQKRMTGLHETAKYDEFSFGRANRGRSVRIGNETINSKKGYFEDRRPASNCDPYLVTSKIFETTCL